MNVAPRQVYLVDDDPAVLKALSRLLRSAGYEARTFTSALAFMEAYRPAAPACLVVDLAMPEVSGLELQEWLARSNNPLPVIFVSGRGEVPDSVRAMKLGAVDFLTKPISETDLLKSIEEALRRDLETRVTRAETEAIQTRLATLTPREREVLKQVVAGKLNKQIAGDLGMAEVTVKFHRAHIMEKMGAESLAELVRMAERVGIGARPSTSPTSPRPLSRPHSAPGQRDANP